MPGAYRAITVDACSMFAGGCVHRSTANAIKLARLLTGGQWSISDDQQMRESSVRHGALLQSTNPTSSITEKVTAEGET